MACNENLTHKLTVDEARKGGQNSGKTRREKTTIRNILNSFLEQDVQDVENSGIQKLAEKMGISGEKSMKELVAAVCVFRSLKNGSLYDLERLVRLIGEDTEDDSVIDKLDEVLGGIDDIAKK